MANLLEKCTAKATAQVEETVAITINKIVGTSNPLRVCMKCVEGDFFTFLNTFPGGVAPTINKPIKAEMVLREKGEFVNVVSVTFDTEQLGKHNLVATYKNPVIL